ncbi:hypothetical protein DEDE109153_01090 [Deinococcus deserti]|uniref:Lipoprotein n=1 Tax=Deinococcus deserti (strain DSM 17065 / CIP 109153 / LMG 22923 / VCD115) TaxID=546414 RepID=C1CVM4_DEIDV|nr:hypothetical protein [Deinococcus deserti]ACO46241.2 Hypothetical protein Deide_13071 [Deinococcus deserti VCD115]
MRKKGGFLVLVGLLTACGREGPIALSVPANPHILHGAWRGNVTSRNQPSPVEVMTLNLTARYNTTEKYDIDGSLTFRGKTYDVAGEGEGRWGATLTPQSTQGHPTLFWEVTIKKNGEVVGDMVGANNPYGSVEQIAVFRLFPVETGQPFMDVYDAKLSRRQ